MKEKYTLVIAVIIVVIVVIFAWYKGWLNSFLPTSWQHDKAGFSPCSPNQASQIDPNIPCLICDPVTGLPTNICARV